MLYPCRPWEIFELKSETRRGTQPWISNQHTSRFRWKEEEEEIKHAVWLGIYSIYPKTGFEPGPESHTKNIFCGTEYFPMSLICFSESGPKSEQGARLEFTYSSWLLGRGIMQIDCFCTLGRTTLAVQSAPDGLQLIGGRFTKRIDRTTW